MLGIKNSIYSSTAQSYYFITDQSHNFDLSTQILSASMIAPHLRQTLKRFQNHV